MIENKQVIYPWLNLSIIIINTTFQFLYIYIYIYQYLGMMIKNYSQKHTKNISKKIIYKSTNNNGTK